ncbi:hypothetical protein QBC37DRAFT_435572 [Rhypophila decipiens]|uniref:Uncharacterized protein n=1 Tax=Rhypophila decipiens TaxID=261697 RepID=A0AAN6XYJ7_9PEZI|nr:hypothetical protein QBC37DRAFT_435572 [Rhypophila decipiens]
MPVRVSRLESLPTEILVLILSAAAGTPADLVSLICTSSILNKCFKSFKVTILTAPALKDLGPGIIDAIAISRIPPLSQGPSDQDHGPLHEKVVQDYIRQYHKSTSLSAKTTSEEGDMQWIIREISPEMAESILHLNMAVQFFIDLYMATRLSYLQNQISWLTHRIKHAAPIPFVQKDPEDLASQRSSFQSLRSAMLLGDDITKPDLKKILSPLERQRLAIAFLRAQLLVTLSVPVMQDNAELRNVRLDGRPFALEPAPPVHPHPGLVPSSPTSENHHEIMALYSAWELEQISQTHYFIFFLCRCVVKTEGNWILALGGASGPWLMDIRAARRAAHRVRMTGITLACQFDLLTFRKRLIKGGARACMDGCLLAENFDSVCCRRRGEVDKEKERKTPEERRIDFWLNEQEEGEPGGPSAGDGLYYYKPRPVAPDNSGQVHRRTSQILGEVPPLYSTPVSREFHGGEDDTILPTFGPGPGSTGNVHQVECHVALRLLLSRGEGFRKTTSGTCMATGGSNCDWLAASHRYKTAPPGDVNNGSPRPGWPEVHGEDDQETKSAPYAWTDALAGMEWDRWGLDFVPIPPPPQPTRRGFNPRQKGVDRRFSRWRWFGMVFWDEERVKAIKGALEDYETGWLNRIWDGDM